MEMTKSAFFCELSDNDLYNVQGGIGPVFWTVIGVVAGMLTDGVIISTTGKSGGEWVSQGINWLLSWF